MSTHKLPLVNRIKDLPTEERAAILDALFEPCTPLHTLSVELLGTRTFSTYDDLIASIGVQLTDLAESSLASDIEWLNSILGAHPRLGAAKIESVQSQAEQTQLNTGDEEEAMQLKQMNEQYEEAFPGLRYVVFVNGRSRAVIMRDMRERIERQDVRMERADAIRAMCEIAADRSRKLQ